MQPNAPFPGRFLVVAGDGQPTTSIWPLIARAREAGYAEAVLVATRPSFVRTRTLGSVDRSTVCGFPFRVVPGGVPVASFPRWQDLAARLERAEGPVVVAP